MMPTARTQKLPGSAGQQRGKLGSKEAHLLDEATARRVVGRLTDFTWLPNSDVFVSLEICSGVPQSIICWIFAKAEAKEGHNEIRLGASCQRGQFFTEFREHKTHPHFATIRAMCVKFRAIPPKDLQRTKNMEIILFACLRTTPVSGFAVDKWGAENAGFRPNV